MVKQLCTLYAFVCRSVTYSVNNFHKHHVTVLAEVVPVDLELSTEDLVLKPSYGLPADAGMILLFYEKLTAKVFFRDYQGCIIGS